jgi:penicillin-binding protein 1A
MNKKQYMGPKKWWHYLFLMLLVGSLVTAAFAALAASIIYPTLPSLEALTDYRPKLPLRVYSSESILLGEFGEERRAYVRIQDVPNSLKKAIIAIEDRRFYEHNGIDTKGIVRAIRNNVTGRGHEGASTITMQVAKNFFSSPTAKRNLITKIKEALLAIKIEKALTKDKILELYINQIYLGQRAYGFAAAAEVYYAKPLKELNLAESALLAGLPKAPSGYNPYIHKDKSISRQHEVLRDMQRYGFINSKEFSDAMETELVFKSEKRAKKLSADYVAEIVRQTLYKQYGDDIYRSGFKVYTTIKKQNQEAANTAVIEGIVNYELRQGYRGPEKQLSIDVASDQEQLLETLKDFEIYNGFIPAIILDADAKSIKVITKRGERLSITGNGLKLVKNYILNNKYPDLIVKVGSLIRVTNFNGSWMVVQLPKVQASLIAVNPETGEVNALIGGFDFNLNKFNHVTQAKRQPGSSFKPFIYSAALEKGFTASTLVDDSPISISASKVGGNEDWEPHNFDNRYDGPIRVRTALTKSKNMVSIRILQSITPRYAQNYATKFGFNPNDNPAYLSMALGAGATTSWQLASAYSVFANSGYRVKPYLISKIIDASGNIIQSVKPADHISANRVIDPRNAFIMTSMMQDVVQRGTARKAKVLGRHDLAGKTGTTNNQMDVWFAGYNPKEVAIAWMGYDTPKSLGKSETGGSSALPIWIKYMDFALKNTPEYKLKMPAGVVQLRINPRSGAISNEFDLEGGLYEYFYHETPPRAPEFQIPSLEDSTEVNPGYHPPVGNDMITNPLHPADEPIQNNGNDTQTPNLPPVEERSPNAQPEAAYGNQVRAVRASSNENPRVIKPQNTIKTREVVKEPELRDPADAAVKMLNPGGY